MHRSLSSQADTCRRVLAIFAALAMALTCSMASSAKPPAPLTASQWQEDLAFLHSRLVDLHPGVHERVDAQDFDRRIQDLHERIPDMTSDEVLVAFKEIVALIPDQHTVATSQDRREELFSYYPVRLVELSDGVFVLAADRAYAELVGLRVVSFGDAPIDEALDRFATIVPADSEIAVQRRRALEMMAPRLAHGLGLTPDRRFVTISVETSDGSKLTRRVEAVTAARTTSWYKHSFGVPTSDFVTLFDDAQRPLPISLTRPGSIRGPRDPYYFVHLEEARTFYLRMNLMRDAEHETLSAFLARMWAEVDEIGPERFVLDLRFNEGGNNFLVQPLVHGLIRRPELNGRVFVLIGRNTFSAAVSTAAMLEREIEPVFIGEPTGQRPNHYSDTRAIVAPHSRFKVEVSRYQWMFIAPWDRRLYIAPHVPVLESSADLLAGRDRALEVALEIDGFQGVQEVLSEALDEGDRKRAIAAYREHKSRFPDVWSDTERTLNRLGYQLLRDKRVEDALIVFELNAETYPDRPNTWDSLGEAHLKAGNRERARSMYSKVLELDPDNDHVREVVEKIDTGSS